MCGCCFKTQFVFLASLPSLALCFQPCSRPFVWLLARTWIRKNKDRFAVYFPFCLLACEQALLFWRAKRASRERASEGPRKGELATIAHKFSFPPRKLRDSVKGQTVTANVPQIREVRTACQGVTVSKQCFWSLKIYFFFPRGHQTSTCPLGWKLNTLILVSFTFEKSSILQYRRLLPVAITNKNIIY